MHALNMLGHGGRAAPAAAGGMIHDLASDVAAQCGEIGPLDLVVGHSLGAIVGLALAARDQHLARGPLIEDPPGLGGELRVADVAAEIEVDVAAARRDPAGRVEEIFTENPLWSRRDAEAAVANCLSLDVEVVVGSLRRSHGDLPGLVASCPVPVQLLAAPPATSAVIGPHCGCTPCWASPPCSTPDA